MTPLDQRPGAALPGSQTATVSVELPTSFKWQKVEAHWDALRPKVAAYWSRLPADGLKKLPGDRASLVQLIRSNYGIEESGAEAQIDAWVAGLSPESLGGEVLPPPARTKDEQRAEGEGMGSVPGAALTPED
jgi:hypothetical protein